MALTATGIGSGLDITNIVNVLVDAEKLPKEAAFNKAEDSIKAKVSAIGSLKSDLSAFQTALAKLADGTGLESRKVETGDSQYFTATADKKAQSGTYSIQVTQLAQAHKVAGSAVADQTLAVGEGTLAFTVAGSSFNVAVAGTDNLVNIAAKINEAPDNRGVTATVITSDAGSRLVFSADNTGVDNQISVTATDTTGVGLGNMFNGAALTQLTAPANAIVSIDNQQVTSQSNRVSGAITGVTLDLTQADSNQTGMLKISRDTETVKNNLTEFVDAYNKLMTSVETLSGYKPDGDRPLQGDAMVRSLASQVRNMVSDRVDQAGGGSIGLFDIGISVDRFGTMTVNNSTLDTALADNMTGVEQLFSTSVTGLGNRLDALAEEYVKTGGVLDSRDSILSGEQRRLDDQKLVFSRKMEQLEARLLKQFNAMDLVVARLNQQSTGLAERLNSLPGVLGR